MSRAAYMREYRANRKKTIGLIVQVADEDADEALRLRAENDRLTGEVARLKRQLAARPSFDSASLDPAFRVIRDPIRDPMREFHPAPKPGQKKRG